MLLTITTTHQPATDLGYLLAKHPDKLQTFDCTFGKAHVFYPESNAERCTAALLLEIDPVGLVRDHKDSFALGQYVNDRPYAASSFLSVAIAQVYSTALSGRSRERAELAQTEIPLQATIAALPCKGGEALLRRLFEPLGYQMNVTQHELDPQFPEWGQSRYFTVTLEATCRLRDLLNHLYVLIPVLDDEKHYWIGDDEVAKLIKHGEGWLSTHPERAVIARRYLKYRRGLIQQAFEQLTETEEEEPENETTEQKVEKPLSLNTQRIGSVVAALKGSGATRILDLGCGEGQLIRELIKDSAFTEIVGVDVSHRMLEIASERLKLDRMPEVQRKRINLLHGSLMYQDARLNGFDAAAIVEVIEHLDPPRLAAFERAVFEFARPRTVIITTPNSEYNVRFETLPAGKFRHPDHRFEWTRVQFQEWANGVAARFGYSARFLTIGTVDEEVGSPTQMGIFTHDNAG